MQGKVRFRLILFVVALILSLAGVAGVFATKALAEDASASLSAARVNVSFKATTASDGASASIDRSVYHAGDEVVLTYKGASVGNDFVIPVAIKVNGMTKVGISELNKVDHLQAANSEYERRMGEAGTMTTYDNLLNYVTSEHSISLGKVTVDTTVEVQYQKVSPVYRMYNKITSEHLFSTNKKEYDDWVAKGKTDSDYWIGEGIDWLAPATTNTSSAVHRLYNADLGAMGHSSHYYTSDEAEMKNLIDNYGWTDDGIDNQFVTGGNVAIYTCYNEELGSAHHYTSNRTEWEGLKAHGWALEEDKNIENGKNGVFQSLMATNWSFNSNYYTVEHYIDGKKKDSQAVAGNANATTQAVAKSYPGYKAGPIAQAKIASNNTTTVKVSYTAQSYKLNLVIAQVDGSTKQSSRNIVYKGAIGQPVHDAIEGQEHSGWYYDQALTSKVDFSKLKMPVGGITLYSKMTENQIVEPDPVPEPEPDVNKYQVTFDYQRADKRNKTLEVEEGATVEEPTRPTNSAFDFVAWCEDPSGTQIYDFSTPITSDKTLYGSWKIKQVTVSFVTNTDATIEPVTLDYGNRTDAPKTSLYKQGHSFAGWYADENCTEEFNFYYEVIKDTTVYAKWDKNSYTFTFDSNGGDYTQSFQVEYGASVVKLDTDPVKEGHQFVGWFDGPTSDTTFDFDNSSITSNKTVYAKWEAYTYKVIFDSDGAGDVSEQEVTWGEFAKAPEGLEKEYHTLAGWYTSGSDGTTLFDFENTPIKENTTLVAKWEINKYTVKFDTVGGSGISDQTIEHGGTVAEVTEPTKKANKFVGWYDNPEYTGDAYVFAKPVTANLILYAKWDQLVTVTFDSNNGTGEKSYVELYAGEKVSAPNTTPASPSTGDATFDGWYTANSYTKFDFENTEINSDTTIYALWEADYWLAPASIVTTGPSFLSSNASNPDYKGERIGTIKYRTQIQEDLKKIDEGDPATIATYNYYLKYDNYHLYTKLYSNGNADDYGEFRILEVGNHNNEGVALTFQAAHSLPEKYGTNSPKWESSTMRKAMQEGGDVYKLFSTTLMNDITELTKATSGSSTGYTIDKLWLISYYEATGTKTSSGSEDGTRYKFYEGKYWGVATEPLGAASNPAFRKTTRGGQEGAMGTRDSGGYWFSGRSGLIRDGGTNSVVPCFGMAGGGYEVVEFIDTHGLSSSLKQLVKRGEAASLDYYKSDPWDNFKDYTWYTDESCAEGTEYDITDPVTEPLTLYGKNLKQYTVTFDFNDETGKTKQFSINYGDLVEKIDEENPDPTIWNFKEWQLDGKTFNFNTSITKDITLKAVWTHTISFNLNGGSPAVKNTYWNWFVGTWYEYEDYSSRAVLHGNNGSAPMNPTRTGYTFQGWFDGTGDDANSWYSCQPIKRNYTFYAKWKANVGKVTYVYDDDVTNSSENPETYTFDQVVTLKDPTRTKEGYYFLGWYNEDGTVKYEKLGDKDYGDVNLYAKWTTEEATVTFNANNGDKTQDITKTTGKGTKVSKPTESITPPCSGATIREWRNIKDNIVFDFENTLITEDITLIAIWDADYWIAPASKMTTGNTADEANVVNPDYKGEQIGVVKWSDEIREDVQKIKDGDEATIKQYTEWMTKDNYHLYTKIGTTGGANDFAEFRIIGVQQHDEDGTALTFQATHMFPEGIISANDGWSSSPARASLRTGGQYYKLFNSKLISDMATINKTTAKAETEETLWLLSYSELLGATYNQAGGMEGSQYTYFKNVGVSGDGGDVGANPALVYSKRDGSRTLTGFIPQAGTWLLRTGHTDSDFWHSRSHMTVFENGRVENGYNHDTFGMAPCFAF